VSSHLSGGLQPALIVAGCGLVLAGAVLVNRQPAARADAPARAERAPGKTALPGNTR
jgi:hypothetical protein